MRPEQGSEPTGPIRHPSSVIRPLSSVAIRTPNDWHLHVRDGAMLKAVMPFTARNFGRAILMPNLVPPVVTTSDAAASLPEARARGAAAGFDFHAADDLLPQGRRPRRARHLYRGGGTIEWEVIGG